MALPVRGRVLHKTLLPAVSQLQLRPQTQLRLQTPPRQPLSYGRPSTHRLGLASFGTFTISRRNRPAVGPAHRRHVHLGAASLAGDPSTIYALSSAPGKAGIAVIRVSGPACLDVYRALCPTAAMLKPRYAAVRTLYMPEDGSTEEDREVLDTDAIVLYFPGPKTVTGEDVLELHVHGGPATVRAVLSAIPRSNSSSRKGVRGIASVGRPDSAIRYAEPGEFTRRAFFHDRVDLAQVEALGAALDAETEQQRRAAVRGGGSGGRQLSRTYDGWRGELLAARAEIEALIDFSEDQHFDESPAELLRGVAAHVRTLLRALAAHEAAADRGSLLRQGIRIALVGPANAGKSSLMNLIAGREASIVSHEAGTTRDVVEASLDLRGYLCTFADTAGFRAEAAAVVATATATETAVHNHGGAGNAVEAEGIRRARQKAADSDVVVVLASVEPTAASHGDKRGQPQPSLCVRYDAETLRLATLAQQCIVVLNKCDVVPDALTLAGLKAELQAAVRGSFGSREDQRNAAAFVDDVPLVTISCRMAEAAAAATDAGSSSNSSDKDDSRSPGAADAGSDPGGIRSLVDRLGRSFAAMTELPPDAQHLLGVTVRQQQLLAQCRGHLEDFLDEATGGDEAARDPDVVLAAEHLRYAADSLARITGRGDAGDIEDVLGVIFEKFCVGK